MLNRANRKAVPAIVVVLRIDFRRIEVQVVGVRGGVVRRGPVVTVRATVVERRTIVVAGGGEDPVSKVGHHLLRLSEGTGWSHLLSFVFPTAHGCRTYDL